MVARICQRLDGSCRQRVRTCPNSDQRWAASTPLLATEKFSDTSILLVEHDLV